VGQTPALCSIFALKQNQTKINLVAMIFAVALKKKRKKNKVRQQDLQF